MRRMSTSILVVLPVVVMFPLETRSEDVTAAMQHRRMRLPASVSFASYDVFRRARLLVRNCSREELKLTAEQAERIDKLLADWTERETASNANRAPLGRGGRGREQPADRRQRNGQRMRDAEETLVGLREVLTPSQDERLDQLVLQQSGLNAVFERQQLVEKLNLNDTQVEEIRKLRRRGRPQQRQEGEPTAYEQFLQLLTPEQRSQWDELLGEPFFSPSTGSGTPSVRSVDVPSLPSPLSLLKYESVRNALHLSDDEEQKIVGALLAWDNQQVFLQEQMIAGALGEELKSVIDQLQITLDEITGVIDSALTPARMPRLGQLSLQQAGVFAFTRSHVAADLNLDNEQRRMMVEIGIKHRELVDSRREKESPVFNQELADAKQQLMREALDVLTEEQRQKWKQMIGEAVHFPPRE